MATIPLLWGKTYGSSALILLYFLCNPFATVTKGDVGPQECFSLRIDKADRAVVDSRNNCFHSFICTQAAHVQGYGCGCCSFRLASVIVTDIIGLIVKTTEHNCFLLPTNSTAQHSSAVIR